MPERPTPISKELDRQLFRQLNENYRALEDMERDLLSKLKKTYQTPIKMDIFGKREALPTEIKAVINPTTMEEGLAQFPPTPEVIKEKDA